MRKLARKIAKRLFDGLLQRQYRAYSNNDHNIRLFNQKILVKAGVFHPGLFFSTRCLVDYLSEFELKGQTLLELGCGTGAISCWAAHQGAVVTASDINPEAIENAAFNARQNHLDINALESDLLEQIEGSFDWIVINPPYYPKQPKSYGEKAWYAGEDFEYFQRLFGSLKVREFGRCIMVLSEDCEIERIKEKAIQNGLSLELVKTHRKWFEHSFIMQIRK